MRNNIFFILIYTARKVFEGTAYIDFYVTFPVPSLVLTLFDTHSRGFHKSERARNPQGESVRRELDNGSCPGSNSMPVAHAVELMSKREESLGSATPKAEGGPRGLSRIDIHEL